MQVDQEDQKLQTGDNGDKKAEAEEMEVTLCWAIRCNKHNMRTLGTLYQVKKVKIKRFSVELAHSVCAIK